MTIAQTGQSTHLDGQADLVDPSTAAGQFLLVGFSDSGGTTNPITMPTISWVQRDNQQTSVGADGGTFAVATLTSSVGGGGGLNFGSTPYMCCAGIAFSGVDNTNPINDHQFTSTVNSGSGTSWAITPPAVTTTVANCMIVIVVGLDPNGTIGAADSYTPPTGFTAGPVTPYADPGNLGNAWGAQTAIFYKVVSATGLYQPPDVTRNLVLAQTGSWVVYTYALAPASGGGATYTLSADSGSYALSGFGGTSSLQYNLAAGTGSFALTGKPVSFVFSGSGPTYTLAAALGSFTLTGKAVGLRQNRRLAAAQGAFALTGEAAALKRGFHLLAAQGAFALSGQAVGLRFNRRLNAAQGAFALTGKAVTLVYTRPGSYVLAAGVGIFALAGQAAGLRAARRLVAAQGAFALSGQAVGLAHGYRLQAAQGAFALSGQTVGLRANRILRASFGQFALTGQDAAFVYSHATNHYTLVAAPGIYALSGEVVGLRYQRILRAGYGQFALTGIGAHLVYTPLVAPTHGGYAEAGARYATATAGVRI